MNPLVSACIISYDQADFIARTLEGALCQKVGFDYEVVIGDDCSTDETLGIIRKVVSEYQGTANIRILDQESNLGMHRNWETTIAACKGKYIAICEGDDFWHDPEKLQKQVRLLEANMEATACFSNAQVLQNDGTMSNYPYVDKGLENLTANDLFSLNYNPIPTCTMVFRRSAFNGFPNEYYKSPFADWILHSLLISKGKYLYLNETTSTYRQHDAGIWSGVDLEEQLRNKLTALKIIRKISDKNHADAIDSAIVKQLDQQLYNYRSQNAYLKYLRTWMRLRKLRMSA